MDITIFTMPEAWISLVTLMFLEIVLGVDNLVFITLTAHRLPPEQERLGRKLGLLGALVSRCIFLSVASWLVHMTEPLLTLPLGEASIGFSLRDLILFFGGLYLVYKGISEMRDVLGLVEEKDAEKDEVDNHASLKRIGLARAIGTIMIMDVVFSIDSVITAVGLANQLIVMILAVMCAVFVMMIFIDAISDFINNHVEMKILALSFIAVIGVLLVLDGLGINSGIMIFDMYAEKLMVYFAMVFSVIITLIQMRRNSNYKRWLEEKDEGKRAE